MGNGITRAASRTGRASCATQRAWPKRWTRLPRARPRLLTPRSPPPSSLSLSSCPCAVSASSRFLPEDCLCVATISHTRQTLRQLCRWPRIFRQARRKTRQGSELFLASLSFHGPLFYKPIATADRWEKSAWYVSCRSRGSTGWEDISAQEVPRMSTYTLISSDSHIIEPPDLWEQRIDRAFLDRAPRLVHEAEADQWYADGVPFGNIGINQQAGVRFETPDQLTIEGRMATVPRGGINPHAHVMDMDADTVAGAVLYPSQGLTVYRIPDSLLLSAIFRAYNDWLADFCQPYPQRLKGIAMLNVDDVADAVAEIQRAAKLGLAGAMIPLRPMDKR